MRNLNSLASETESVPGNGMEALVFPSSLDRERCSLPHMDLNFPPLWALFPCSTAGRRTSKWTVKLQKEKDMTNKEWGSDIALKLGLLSAVLHSRHFIHEKWSSLCGARSSSVDRLSASRVSLLLLLFRSTINYGETRWSGDTAAAEPTVRWIHRVFSCGKAEK